MALPFATTTIDVISISGDPYENHTETTVFSNVPAHFSAPRGSDQIVGGEEAVTDMELYADPVALQFDHVVVDKTLNQRWQVRWVQQRRALGLDHCHAGVDRIDGAA